MSNAFVCGAAAIATSIILTTSHSSIEYNKFNCVHKFVKDGIIKKTSTSRSVQLPYEVQTWRELRCAKIKAIQGKYAFVPTSSEEFIRSKWEEIEKEGDTDGGCF
ncbi:hypothetical protein [Carboxydocella sp. JDF658]|uniref:hypothetical protein n=1 Tax=Carboxydocella sp. JDF658 TaxID=1926600 RepID=UPI0009ABCD7E|nr:hypothetical protein [Carboxydocella sp. JDF658]GAW30898.1 hypothetical protein JDF658_06630 [Carboxydocella sp. JDF658]